MSLAIEGASTWRASVERANPIRAADPLGSGASFSPWQALMASAALAQNGETGGWGARIEPGPAVPQRPVSDDPERVETAEAREAKTPASDNAAPKSEPQGLFENGDFSLADLIDVINPLQHIPIVSTIYRELTGDRIGHGARLAGGVLFMGPFGGLSALANIVLLEASGKDIGDHALALLKDDPATATADAANANTNSGEGESRQNDKVADEKALAELLPPGAIPLPGRSVDFAQAALRPAALVPAPAPAPASSADDDLPPPPPPGPIAGPGWKGFYSPRENPAEAGPSSGRHAPPESRPIAEPQTARRAYAPDPMAALAAKRTPGAMAGALAAPQPAPGAIADEGGWFSDTMLSALAKYEDARRLRGPQAPEAGRREAVNVVN